MGKQHELNPRKKSCIWTRSTSGRIRRDAIKGRHCRYLPLPMEKVLSTSGVDNRRLRRHIWAILVAMLVVGGIVSSTLAATGDAHAQGETSQTAFLSSSQEIAAVLEVALQHEEDLVVGAQAFVVGDPHASEAQFVAWADAVHAMARYPELRGFGEARHRARITARGFREACDDRIGQRVPAGKIVCHSAIGQPTVLLFLGDRLGPYVSRRPAFRVRPLRWHTR